MFRPFVKLFFLAKATFEVARERVEDVVDSLTARAGECKASSNDHLHEAKEKVKQVVGEIAQNIWQRSEVLESQTRRKNSTAGSRLFPGSPWRHH